MKFSSMVLSTSESDPGISERAHQVLPCQRDLLLLDELAQDLLETPRTKADTYGRELYTMYVYYACTCMCVCVYVCVCIAHV